MSSSNDKLKVFVIGSASNDADWMYGKLVKNLEDADICLLTGGADIHPMIYNEKVGSYTHAGSARDNYEIDYVRRAKNLGIPIFGICRGAQLLCALAGGKLIQHMSHPSSHAIKFWDNKIVCSTSSCHHQMQYPYLMNKSDYYILGYSEGLSRMHLGEDDQELDMPDVNKAGLIKEPELVYYPKLKALGIQGHPEGISDHAPLCHILRALIQLLVNNQLEDALKIGLGPMEIRSRAAEFIIKPDEQQLLNHINNHIDDSEYSANPAGDISCC